MAKKICIGMLAAAAMLATSCQNDLDLGNVGGETAQLTISVGTPQGTRAYAEGNNATLLQYAVYDEAGELLPALTVTNAHIEGSTEVTLTLAANNTYSVLFWAQNAEAPYSVNFEEKTLSVDYSGVNSNDDTLDAFYCYKEIKVATGAQSETIKLTRPFAQLNIGTGDLEKATAAGYTPTLSTVTVKDLATTLDLVTGETDVNTKQAVTFASAAIPAGETFPVAGYDYLAMNYVLVGNGVENVEVEFNYTDGTIEGEPRTVSYVPVERNHRTNIYGNILTTGVNVKVEIEGEPIEDGDHNVDYVDGALVDINGNLVPGVTPTATINKLEAQTVTGTGLGGTATGDFVLPFVMEFVADQTAEDMATCPYADWYADFVLTFTGIEGDSFIADGCYLAGNYGTYDWVVIPVDGLEIEDGTRYPVMLGYGGAQLYKYICEGVQNFKCALSISPEILAANPNIEVTLELSLVDSQKGTDVAKTAIEDPEKKCVNVIVENTYTAKDFAITFSGTASEVKAKLAEWTEGTEINILQDLVITGGDWESLSISNDLTINGNGHTITGLNKPLCGRGGVDADLVVKDLTIAGSTIEVNDGDDNGLGAGAFAYSFEGGASTPAFYNCHLVNSSVTCANYAGGILGYSAANQDSAVIIDGCSVEESCTITGGNSTGGLIGHTQNDINITNSKVWGTDSDYTIVECTEDRSGKAAKAGAVIGTVTVGTATLTGVTVGNVDVKHSGTQILFNEYNGYIGRLEGNATVSIQ